jgi:hypothetical protein
MKEVRVADLVDRLMNEMKRDDLFVTQNFTVKAVYDSISGKWPS